MINNLQDYKIVQSEKCNSAQQKIIQIGSYLSIAQRDVCKKKMLKCEHMQIANDSSIVGGEFTRLITDK